MGKPKAKGPDKPEPNTAWDQCTWEGIYVRCSERATRRAWLENIGTKYERTRFSRCSAHTDLITEDGPSDGEEVLPEHENKRRLQELIGKLAVGMAIDREQDPPF